MVVQVADRHQPGCQRRRRNRSPADPPDPYTTGTISTPAITETMRRLATDAPNSQSTNACT